MSFCYGPIVLPGLGQLTSTTISQQSKSLVIENQSLYDVLFSVQTSQPQTLTQQQIAAIINSGQPITTGGWDLHIGPRAFGVLEISEGDLTQAGYAGGYWTGTVWVLQASLPNVQTTAGSFTSDPGPNIWITAYGPGEKLPDPGIASLGYFLASQERYVTIPPSPFLQVSTQVLPGAINSFANIGAGIFIGNLPFSSPAITAGVSPSGQIIALTYLINLSMIPLSAVAGTAESQSVVIRYTVQDHTFAVVGSAVVYGGTFSHLALQSDARDNISFSAPLTSYISVVAGAGGGYSLNPQLEVFSVVGGGGTNIKPMFVNMSYDVATAVPSGASGGTQGILPGQTYNGFIY